jgi:hypothetical protein
MVLVEYCCATTAKKKREFLALFFDFLLLNGADANKECTIQREIVDWWRPTEVVPWKLPSVARILEDPSLYALPVWPEGHPYKSDACQRIIKSRLDIQTAQFFHKRLAQFTSGETARFETYEGEWLRDMMPEPPVVQEQNESDDEEGGKQDQTERNKDEKESLKDLFNQLQQDPPQKSTWEKWKPSLTYFVAGATMSGLAYWLGTRSWGDPHEERRQERQRARVLRV